MAASLWNGGQTAQSRASPLFTSLASPVLHAPSCPCSSRTQVLVNVTTALAGLPPAIVLPDPISSGEPASSSDSPFTPAAAPMSPHATYFDTSITALERLSPTGDSPFGYFVADVLLSLNDSRVDSLGGSELVEDALLGDASATARAALSSLRAGSGMSIVANEIVGRRLPQAHEGYMVSPACALIR
eukprot:scaffold137727_cov35-Tisochrysis_lutea.AAC.7